MAVSPEHREQIITKGRIALANQQTALEGTIGFRGCSSRIAHSIPLCMGHASPGWRMGGVRPIASAHSMHWPSNMDKDPAMRVMVKGSETGRGRRVAFMVIAVLAVAVLLTVVVVGFRGRNIPQAAAAMTTPVAPATNVASRPWWLP